MAKIKKPAPKGGKKTAAPVKKVAKKKAVAPKVFKEILKSARQMDQAVADKLRDDAFAAANAAGLHPPRQTVEEQWADAFQKAVEDATFKPKKPSMWARFRSAVTGLFVSKKFAEANPDTTVREKAR